MEYLQTIVLALIQGATEFLPVSSSAHLILPHALLGWPDQGILFDATLHAGTLTAVIIHQRVHLISMVASVLRWRRDEDFDLAFRMVLATLPLVVLSPFLVDVAASSRSTTTIATTTVVFGVLLLLSDRRPPWSRHPRDRTTSQTQLTHWGAIAIGFAQVFAVIPGTSRAGVTITAALFLGLARREAVSFSFLLAIPTMIGALLLSMAEFEVSEHYSAGSLALGYVVAAVAAFVGLEWFIRAVERIGMAPFVVYRIVLGGLLAGLSFYGLA